MNTIFQTYEIPKKEVIPNKRIVEKENQSNKEEKPLMVIA